MHFFPPTGYPIVNDPLYNHVVFGPEKGKDGNIGKTDEELIHDLISIHNAENWLGGEGDDFAPNFFSAVIPPESTNAATPASSSADSVGLPSGLSSRSQTPDVVVSSVKEMTPLPLANEADAVVALSEIVPIKEEANSTTTMPDNSSSSASQTADCHETPLTELVPLDNKTTAQSNDECAAAIGNLSTSLETDRAQIASESIQDTLVKAEEENGGQGNPPQDANKTDRDGNTIHLIYTFSLTEWWSDLIFQIDSAVAASSYNSDKVTHDEHCYECKVRFRDPKPKDLMMFLHAWRYKVSIIKFQLLMMMMITRISFTKFIH